MNRCEWADCGKQFTTASYLRKHQNSAHLNPKPKVIKTSVIKKPEKPQSIPCDWPGCDQTYTNRSNVLKHMKKTHLDKKIYKCQYLTCTQAFADKRQLIVHRVNAHNFKKPNKCDWPGCEFMTCYPQVIQL